jgi:hypothetical protein
MKKYRFIFCGFILLFNGCCKEKVNPCKNVQVTSADFVIEEVLFADADYPEKNVLIETDTVNGSNLIRFTSKQTFDEYTWLIGSEVIHEKSFSRKYFPENSTITVTLIGKRKPNKECFPNDDGMDTIKKTFYTISKNLKLEQRHTYQGYNIDNPADTFTIQLAYWHTQYKEWDLRMDNFPKGWNNDGIFFIGGNTWLYLNTLGSATNPGLKAFIKFSKDNNYVTINYTINQALRDYLDGKRPNYEPPILISKTFKGTKK